MRRLAVLVGSVLAGLALAAPVRAQEITVRVDPDLAAAAGVDAAAVEREIRGATGGTLKLDGPEAFLDQMANANALATKGMGVDYASSPQRFFAGASFGTATSGAGFGFLHGDGALPTAGFAFQAAANAGLNLGILSPEDSFLRRFVLSANGAWARGLSGPFDAELSNVGAHLQLKLIRPPTEGLVSWGGLDITGGYEVSAYRLTLSDALPVAAGDLRWDATGSLAIAATSTTLPVEVSSSFRVFVVTVYGGAALDIRRDARADGEMALTGPLVVAAAGEERTVGTVDARLSMAGQAAEYAPRAFAGTQVNILFVKVYGHLNMGLDDTWAGHLGARVAL